VVVALLGRPWTGQKGPPRPLTLEDILVVAPFNAHVNRLVRALPPGARVGTVDRFQGQEAPVVIYSLAASTADDVPRGLEFLYSLNRLNVAVSRAQGLAVLVASPALLDAKPRHAEQLPLINALCRFVENATVIDTPSAADFYSDPKGGSAAGEVSFSHSGPKRYSVARPAGSEITWSRSSADPTYSTT